MNLPRRWSQCKKCPVPGQKKRSNGTLFSQNGQDYGSHLTAVSKCAAALKNSKYGSGTTRLVYDQVIKTNVGSLPKNSFH